MDYEKKYEKLVDAVKVLRDNNPSDEGIQNWVNDNVPELKEESRDEKIRKNCIHFLELQKTHHAATFEIEECIAWLEKQGEQKEINLVEILKHYPRETELYSPLYGKIWLAEVDEKYEIIYCYKHPLYEGCTRAVLEQEDIVSFYPNGTKGLPDFSISKDCMLFLYNIENQGGQKCNNQFTKQQAYILDKHIDKFLEQKSVDKVEPRFKI